MELDDRINDQVRRSDLYVGHPALIVLNEFFNYDIQIYEIDSDFDPKKSEQIREIVNKYFKNCLARPRALNVSWGHRIKSGIDTQLFVMLGCGTLTYKNASLGVIIPNELLEGRDKSPTIEDIDIRSGQLITIKPNTEIELFPYKGSNLIVLTSESIPTNQ